VAAALCLDSCIWTSTVSSTGGRSGVLGPTGGREELLWKVRTRRNGCYVLNCTEAQAKTNTIGEKRGL